MREISTFHKALLCGAAATVVVLFAAISLVAFLIVVGITASARERRPAVAAAPSARAGYDPVVATVNGVPIPKRAVARAYRQSLELHTRIGSGTAQIFLELRGLEHAAVSQLVDHQIALAEARRLGIDVTLADVHAWLATQPPFLQNGEYVGEARALEVLARRHPDLRREDVLEAYRRDLVIERLEAIVTRGLPAPARLPAYQAFIHRARSLAAVTVDPAVLSQIVRETR
jgi:hypothetical protein